MNTKGCLVSGLIILLGELLVLGIFTVTAGQFLTAVDTLSPADAIVVLGGDAERAELAVDLFNQGYASTVVFSGGTLADAGLACSSSQLSLEAAQELGLPTEVAIIAHGAQRTYDDAVNICQLAQQ